MGEAIGSVKDGMKMEDQCGAVGSEAARPSSRRMSKDLRRNKEQRQKIFEAIAKVMAREGSGALTMDSIASRLGGSKGTIYYYFKSKGDMLYQMQMYGYDLVTEAVYPILDNTTIPPRERLEQAIYTQMLVTCENWRLWRAMWADVDIPRPLLKALRRRRTMYEKKVTVLVEEVLETEGWDCIEPKTVTRLMIGLVDSISRWYRKGGLFSSKEVAALAAKCALYGPFERSDGPYHSTG